MKNLIYVKELYRKYKAYFLANSLVLVVSGAMSAGSLLTIGPVVDFFLHPDLKGVSGITLKAIKVLDFLNLPVGLSSWLIVFGIIAFVSSGFQLLLRFVIFKIRYAVEKDITVDTYSDFFKAGWMFFSNTKHGVLFNDIVREVSIIGSAFSSMGHFCAELFRMVIIVVIPFMISWKVTLISLGAGCVCAVPFMLVGGISYRLGKERTKSNAGFISSLQESINMAKVVIGYNRQWGNLKKIKSIYDVNRNSIINFQILKDAIVILYRPFGVFMIIVALFSARRFEVPVSEMMVLVAALFEIAASIGRIPFNAEPIATPVIAFSDVGMSKTLSSPNFSLRPSVVPKTPLGSSTPRP